MASRGIKKAISDYWLNHYVNNGHCSLCGNHGVIDTSHAVTPVGLSTGRRNWCICPNGQILRYHSKGNLPK